MLSEFENKDKLKIMLRIYLEYLKMANFWLFDVTKTEPYKVLCSCFVICILYIQPEPVVYRLCFKFRTLCGSRIRVTFARPRTRGRGQRGYDPNMRCYQCGERGHFSRDCPDTKYGYKRPPSRYALLIGLISSTSLWAYPSLTVFPCHSYLLLWNWYRNPWQQNWVLCILKFLKGLIVWTSRGNLTVEGVKCHTHFVWTSQEFLCVRVFVHFLVSFVLLFYDMHCISIFGISKRGIFRRLTTLLDLL